MNLQKQHFGSVRLLVPAEQCFDLLAPMPLLFPVGVWIRWKNHKSAAVEQVFNIPKSDGFLRGHFFYITKELKSIGNRRGEYPFQRDF